MVRAIAAAALAIAFAPCYGHGGDHTHVPTYAPTAAPTYAPTAAPAISYNLVELAMMANADGDFDILIGAVVKADLVDALSNTGPYTVFAPTDDAFEALNITTDSLDDYNVTTLTQILLYHTVPGVYTATEVVASSNLTTVEGEDIEVDGTVLNGYVNITAVDAFASNGVVHVIDGVLIPPSLS